MRSVDLHFSIGYDDGTIRKNYNRYQKVEIILLTPLVYSPIVIYICFNPVTTHPGLK